MNRLEKFFLTTGIIISSLIPLKLQAQYQEDKNNDEEPTEFYYGSVGLSIKRLDNLALDKYFGAIFGMKGGVGLNTGKLSRIEFEAELAFKKNKNEDLELSTLGAGAYYDIVLNPNKKMIVYGGVGVKALSLILQENYQGNKSDQAKTSGIGFGIRGGVEGKIEKTSTLYLEISYDNISGTLDEETTNLSGSGLTFGLRTRF